MERTEFQQRMAELKEQSERRRYDVLRKKYAIAPDFSNMSLRDEVGVRYDLDELEQLKQKYGVPTNMPVDNTLAERFSATETAKNSECKKYIPKYFPRNFMQSCDVLEKAKNEMDIINTPGSDNYYHSVGMCENAQAGRPISTLMLGIAKEGIDFWNKTKEGKPIGETLFDNTKDIGNNIRGVYYGLWYPNQSCRDIFQRLDWKTNKMR